MDEDLHRIQGSWVVTALQMDGEKAAGEFARGCGHHDLGQRFTTTGIGAVYHGSVELDRSVTPGHIDLRFDAGPEKGNINRGIYEFDGDQWRIWLATRGKQRLCTRDFRARTGGACG